MKNDRNLSPLAAKLVDLAREVPPLDRDRREQMKRDVLAKAPAVGARPGERLRKPVSMSGAMRSLRLPLLSVLVVSAVVAAVAVPWARLRSSAVSPVPTRLSESEATARATPTAFARAAPSSVVEVVPDALPSTPETTDRIPTVSSPHALASVKQERRRSTEPGYLAAPEAVVPSAAGSPAASFAAAESSGSSLQEEIRLVRGADAAVSARDPERALWMLREHERRFPRGVLASERDMLFVLALCAVGNDALANERAARFRGSYPRSPLQDRLQHSCAREVKP